MKKLVIVSAMNFNNNSAGSKRVDSYCRSLSSLVKKIYLISLNSKIINGKFKFECVNDNIYLGKGSNKNRSMSSIFRFINNFQKFIDINPKIKIILYPSSFFIFDLIIVLYLLFKRIPFYVELNEVRKYNLYFIKRNIFKKENIFHNLKVCSTYPFYVFMDFLFMRAKGHIYISSKISKYYGKKNSIIIPILCNYKNENSKNFKSFKKLETFTLGFAGTINPFKERMSVFFDSINKISQLYPNIRVNLYGYFPHEDIFYSLLDKYGIKDFFFYNGFIRQEELIGKMKEENHLLILPRGFTKQNYYGFSTKLSEYLETQLPVLTSTVGDIGEYFIDMENSFTYKHDKADSLTKKLEFIMENYNKITPKIVKGGDRLVNDTFHYSNHSNKLYLFLFN